MQPADVMLPPRLPPQRRKLPLQPPPVHKKQFNPSQHSTKYKEWMSPEILQLIKEKERAYSLWKKSKASPTEVESLRLKYRTISNMYTAKKRTAQRQLEENGSGESTKTTDDTSTENTDESTAAVTNGSKGEVVNEKVHDDDVVGGIELDTNAELSVDKEIETVNVGLKDFVQDSMGMTDDIPDLSCATQNADSSTSVSSALKVPTHNGSDSIGNIVP